LSETNTAVTPGSSTVPPGTVRPTASTRKPLRSTLVAESLRMVRNSGVDPTGAALTPPIFTVGNATRGVLATRPF
jgi:hypothetical protein